MNNPLLLIIRLAFSLYIYCIILRALFEWIRIDSQNPLAQYVYRLTTPTLKYIKKVLPSRIYAKAGIILLLGIAELAKLYVVSILYGAWPNFISLLGWAFFDLIQQLITLYTYILFIQIVFSYLIAHKQNPMSYLVYVLTYRPLKAIRRFVPTIKGFDLSPLVAILIIQLINAFIVGPLSNMLMLQALS